MHRDIKPQNLMLCGPEGLVKILDFGLARFVSEQAHADGTTERGMLMGSPDYMAPEQGRDGHSADARADIYGMGCTLYHLLTGQVPFPATSLLAKLEAHRDKQPTRLNHLRPDVPLALANVVARMMAKDPAQRYQSPAEALRPFSDDTIVVDDEPATVAGRLSASIPEGRSSKRRPRILIFLALGLLALGILSWPIIIRIQNPDGTETRIEAPTGAKVIVEDTTTRGQEPTQRPGHRSPAASRGDSQDRAGRRRS